MEISSAHRTVLLTLGRLPVALELARALHAGGWRVLVAEPLGWHLCRLSTAVEKTYTVTAPVIDSAAYVAQIEKIVRDENVSLVVPVSEETVFVSALHGRLPESVTLLCIAQASLLQLHDKYLFAHLAQQHGLYVAHTALASDIEACKQITAMDYVIKPRLSCSGVGVRFGTAGTRLSTAELNDRYIVQRRLSGASCSSFSIASRGQVLTSVCYKSLIESGSVSVCFEQIKPPEEVLEFIDNMVRMTAYSGMIAFDFIQDENGVWRAIECNPRATSGIHFLQPAHVLKSLISHEAADIPPFLDKRKEFWSCLMKVEGALFRGRFDRDGWRHFFSSRDVTWRWSDPKPFLLMSFVLAPQLYKAMRAGRPVSEILMSDVGWHEPDL